MARYIDAEALMKKLKYYIFCINWLWKNRNWKSTRQKFKAMKKASQKYLEGGKKQ